MLCPMTRSDCTTCDPQQGCAMARGVGYSQVQQTECQHDWQIESATDGLSQECTRCHAHRMTPEEDKFWKRKTQEEIAKEVEQAQADSLEAHSLKYHHCAQIFQLSSGRYALFGSFAPGEGIPLIAIGSWQELEPHVREYKRIADAHAERPRPMKVDVKAQPSTAYDDLFGDQE